MRGQEILGCIYVLHVQVQCLSGRLHTHTLGSMDGINGRIIVGSTFTTMTTGHFALKSVSFRLPSSVCFVDFFLFILYFSRNLLRSSFGSIDIHDRKWHSSFPSCGKEKGAAGLPNAIVVGASDMGI